MAKGKKDPVGTQGAENVELKAAKIGAEKTSAALQFKPIAPKAAKLKRPFDGYPLMRKVQIGEAQISGTFIVAANPTIPVRQDAANKLKKSKDGKMTQMANYHSRSIRDYENRTNEIVIFDRKLTIGNQDYYCAVIPSHNIRAQLCYKYNSKSKQLETDNRYLFLDEEQSGRLRQVFEQIINPKLKLEREADFLSGTGSQDAGEVKPLTEDEV